MNMATNKTENTNANDKYVMFDFPPGNNFARAAVEFWRLPTGVSERNGDFSPTWSLFPMNKEWPGFLSL